LLRFSLKFDLKKEINYWKYTMHMKNVDSLIFYYIKHSRFKKQIPSINSHVILSKKIILSTKKKFKNNSWGEIK
jgi:hypothetical protein